MFLKQRIHFLAISSFGYSIVLGLFIVFLEEMTKYHLFKEIEYFPMYIMINAFVFTLTFYVFRTYYGQSNIYKRIKLIVFIYAVFLILVFGINACLYQIMLCLNKGFEIAFFHGFKNTLLWILVGLSLLWKALIVLGIISFFFTEIIRYFLLKNEKAVEIEEKKSFFSVALIVLVFITLYIFFLRPTYVYHKTERIENTNLQAVIYIQDNYTSIGFSNDFAYRPAYVELQDLSGALVAKQFLLNRCTVQIGEIYFKIKNNKLYYTKFDYIDLSNYQYYCF